MEYKEEGFLPYVETARKVACRRENLRGKLEVLFTRIEEKAKVSQIKVQDMTEDQVKDWLMFFKLL
jgi:AmiR/NasT family two-component response regulator